MYLALTATGPDKTGQTFHVENMTSDSSQDTSQPFQDIRQLLRTFPSMEQGSSTDPSTLQGLSRWLGGWGETADPDIHEPLVAIYAGSYGLAVTSATDITDAKAQFANLEAGTSELAKLAGELGAGLRAFDLALAMPSPDVSQGASFSESDCAANIAFGMEVLAAEADLIILGEAGLGSDLAATIVGTRLFEAPLERWAFRSDLSEHADKLEMALARNRGETEPLSVLADLGSRELAAHLGALVAARHMGVPVFLDGPTAGVAALLFERIAPGGAAHCWLTNPGKGEGAKRLVEHFERRPILALEDELSGGLLTLGLLQAC